MVSYPDSTCPTYRERLRRKSKILINLNQSFLPWGTEWCTSTHLWLCWHRLDRGVLIKFRPQLTAILWTRILSHLQNHEVSLKNDTVSDIHHYQQSKTCQHKHISMTIFQLIKVYLITKSKERSKSCYDRNCAQISNWSKQAKACNGTACCCVVHYKTDFKHVIGYFINYLSLCGWKV
jgi:hypothetical protein